MIHRRGQKVIFKNSIIIYYTNSCKGAKRDSLKFVWSWDKAKRDLSCSSLQKDKQALEIRVACLWHLKSTSSWLNIFSVVLFPTQPENSPRKGHRKKNARLNWVQSCSEPWSYWINSKWLSQIDWTTTFKWSLTAGGAALVWRKFCRFHFRSQPHFKVKAVPTSTCVGPTWGGKKRKLFQCRELSPITS